MQRKAVGLQAYPCLCAYYAIYKLGRFSFYLLVPRHTSPYSLLANAMLMCRFAPPLAFNFMAGIALPPGKSYSPGRDVTETVRPLYLCTTGHTMFVLMILCRSAADWPCRKGKLGALPRIALAMCQCAASPRPGENFLQAQLVCSLCCPGRGLACPERPPLGSLVVSS